MGLHGESTAFFRAAPVVFRISPTATSWLTEDPKRHRILTLIGQVEACIASRAGGGDGLSSRIVFLLTRMSRVIRGCPAMNRKAKVPFDPKEFLSKVNGGQRTSDYRKDQIVYRQGDPADAVFYIQNGKVKKTVVSEQGKEAVVALLGAGDFFGEGSLAGEALRLATVSALTKCTIARISKATLRA